jgi:adenylate kinase family enzyme
MLGFFRPYEKAILVSLKKGKAMQRIVILGCTGSGKTTFGRKLAARLGYPATDLDDLNWLPGWTMRPTEEFFALAKDAASHPQWVIIGNYSRVREAIWPRADMFIWLDYPFPRVFWQLLRRSVLRAVDKNPICNGNIESWKQFFSKESIMLWFFKTFRKRRREYGAIFAAGGNSPNIAYIRLRSPKAAEEWLQNLASKGFENHDDGSSLHPPQAA